MKRIREKKNIPPSIIARKIKDKKIRRAILYYEQFLKGKTYIKVSSLEKVKKIREKEIKEKIEKINKEIEQDKKIKQKVITQS